MRTPYPGHLPYHIPAWAIPAVVQHIQQNGLWSAITPGGLQAALVAAWNQRAPIEITQHSLDQLPDDVWNKLAAMIPAGVLS
jgi:hypothetical protein